MPFAKQRRKAKSGAMINQSSIEERTKGENKRISHSLLCIYRIKKTVLTFDSGSRTDPTDFAPSDGEDDEDAEDESLPVDEETADISRLICWKKSDIPTSVHRLNPWSRGQQH